MMTIAPTLWIFLETKLIEYELIKQVPTMSSASSAEACRTWVSVHRLIRAAGLDPPAKR